MQFTDNRFELSAPERTTLTSAELSEITCAERHMNALGCCSGCGAYFQLKNCIARKNCPGQGNAPRDHCDRSIENAIGYDTWVLSKKVAIVMKKEGNWPKHLVYIIEEDCTNFTGDFIIARTGF
jgi:hypothetical protein